MRGRRGAGADGLQKRGQTAFAGDGAEDVEREHVGRAFPDRQHLGVAQQHRDAGVLDVAGAAEGFEALADDGDGLLAGHQLGDGLQQPEQRPLLVADDAGLLAAEQGDGAEDELEGRLRLRLHPRQRVDVQRLLGKRRAEGDAAPRVVARQRHAAAHEAGGADRIPGARDVEHRGDHARAVRQPADGLGESAVELQLRGRERARAELVLQAVDADAVQAALGPLQLEVEHRQTATAGTVALRSRQGQCHVGGGRRGEPLVAVEAPAFGRLPGDGFRKADVGAADALGHPLS